MDTIDTSSQRGPDAFDSMLAPFRVLDLTEGGCQLGGKVLGDMGADVIKVERPGGSPTRSVGPFWANAVYPEHSLFWMAYNVNKRGITLNVESAAGAALLKRLVASADFLLESFPPGYLDSLGLGYEALAHINPSLIMVSITPFGPTGPKAHNAWSDFTVWASGGPLYLTGDPSSPPVGVSFMHQTTLNAGAEAAAAAMIAHHYRQHSGEGQHVDVSMQEVAYWVMTSWQEFWETEGTVPRRMGGVPRTEGTRPRERRDIFRTKDGFISFTIAGGNWAGGVSTKRVAEWIRDDGMAPDWLIAFNWSTDFDLSNMTNEKLDHVEEPFVRYFATKTTAELAEQALRDRVMLGPIYTPADIGSHPHLEERGFFEHVWDEVHQSELVFCGPPIKASLTPLAIRRRPPRIGEHNHELYIDELGLSPDELQTLQTAGAI